MRNIFVIAGHGGKDSGAVYKQYVERDLAIQFRDAILAELRSLGVLAKTDPNQNALADTLAWLRGKFGSKDILLDIHWNAGPPAANGAEIFIPDAPSAFEKQLATALLRPLTDSGFRNRGVKTESQSARRKLGWMRPAAENILIEVCFLTSDSDMRLYEIHKKAIARRMAVILRDFSKI